MKAVKKFLAVFIVLSLVFCIAQPAYGLDQRGQMTDSVYFSVMSDIHYYPESLMGDKSEQWYSDCRAGAKQYNESDAILTSALTAVGEKAEEQGTKYLLIPGDLTRNSEYEAHVQLAKKLEAFEAEYGIQVIVTNGNHDVNVDAACTYENNFAQPTRATTAAEFREIYKNLGFDLATEEFKPTTENSHGMLSYVVDLNEGYRIIVVDGCIYDPDERGYSETGGYISDEQMKWIEAKTKEATAADKTPFMMIHHSLAPHMELEPSVTQDFTLVDYRAKAEAFADLGINYAFTGHLHTSDVSSVVSDKGNALYDCETPSLTGYPNQFRNVVFETYENGETLASFNNVDADSVLAISVDGKTYEQGTFKYDSFAICFGGFLSDDGYADVTEFLLGMASGALGGIANDIVSGGGILEYIKGLGIDVEEILKSFLSPYIGDGIGLGGYNIFSTDNIMWFVEDLCSQIEDLYLKDTSALIDALRPILNKLMSIPVSTKPCTKFIDDYHFGDASKPGTLGDAVLSAMCYWYSGNEDISDDAFMLDTIEQFENGDTIFTFFDTLLDVAFNDLVDGLLLSKLEIRLDTLFGDSCIGKKLGNGLNKNVLKYVLREDFSYKNLVDTVFGLGVLPYTSLFDVLDKLLIEEYLTDSQLESVGHTVAYSLSDFVTDSNPIKFGDYDVTYSSAKVTPEATTKNYRLPTMITLTMGEDSQTSATLNWFSKESLSATDIEIYKADGSTVTFTGNATDQEDVPFSMTKSEKIVERYYPGIDIGVIGFFKYYFNMYQHTISLTNLEPGTKYVYRVGNEEYGWWSETGTIETADGGNEVTFFHMSDPQSQNEKQYKQGWANTVEAAFKLYPDAKFIANTGDIVDFGMNNNQWQWVLDTAASNLMSTYHMPTTGNHESKDEHSTVNNFVLPNVPEQDTASGVYYSYTYNNVHVAVLNTNDLNSDEALNEAQVEWLKNDMNQSDAQWKIVTLHKALYSNGSHYDDDDVCAMREQLGKLMPELGIDLVLQGHDHVYLRTHSLDGNEIVQEKKVNLSYNNQVYESYLNPAGTSYVISGCSGVKTYLTKDVSLTDKLFPRAAKIVNAQSQVFSAIQIVDGVLYYNSYLVDGDEYECIDKFAIDKDGSGVQTQEPADIEVDKVETEKANVLDMIIKYLGKILNVAWNVFRMYVLEYAWKCK